MKEINIMHLYLGRGAAVLMLVAMLLPGAVLAQKGILFEHDITLADAREKARLQNRIVFLDAYTTWCGPCKMMSARVFPDSALGVFFNERFVSLKIDMEKGEGPSLALRYNVEYYPTLLFLDAEGKVLHKAVGFHNADELQKLARVAIDPAGNLQALEARYLAGERNADLLRALTSAKGAAYDPAAGQLANDYLKTQTNPGSAENMDFIMRYVDDPFSEGFRFLQNNRAAFERKYTEQDVKQKMELVFDDYLQRHPRLQLGEVQRLYGAVYPEQGERLASNYRLSYYRQREDMKNFALSAVDHYTRFPSDDADELNEIAYLFAQNVTDPELLRKAVEWAEKSVATQENNYNQDTLARLYLQTGRKKQAAAAARRAIELAKKAGEDASQTEQLLQKINGK